MENEVKVSAMLKTGEVTEGYLSGRIFNNSGDGINLPISDLMEDIKSSGFVSEFEVSTGNLIRVVPISNISYLIPN